MDNLRDLRNMALFVLGSRPIPQVVPNDSRNLLGALVHEVRARRGAEPFSRS